MADPTGGAVVIITGDKECADFFRLCAAMSPSGMFKGLRKGAMRVEHDAKVRAPVDRGALRASIDREEHPDQHVIFVGPSVIYGRIQELGGVIRPVKGQWLTFQAGIKGARAARAALKTVRKQGGDITSAKARVSLAEGDVGWVRVRQVTIRPHPYLGPALDANIANIEHDVAEGVSEALKAANGRVRDIGRLL